MSSTISLNLKMTLTTSKLSNSMEWLQLAFNNNV